MTDNEIIKALECCKMPVGSGSCNNCPLKDTRDNMGKADVKSCTTIALESTIDLINRQKAEIERLTEHNKILMDRVGNLVYECDCAKQEAIEEFADRLKDRKYLSSEWSHGGHPYVVEVDDIDDLEKEMTEGDK